MKLIICLDDKNGMLFNGRRQSRDSAVVEDVLKSTGNQKLNILPFSQALFSVHTDRVSVVSEIGDDGTYFIENADVLPFVNTVQEIVVYRWNRVYPSDFTCCIDFSQFQIKEQYDFAGSSHEKITKIIYSR